MYLWPPELVLSQGDRGPVLTWHWKNSLSNVAKFVDGLPILSHGVFQSYKISYFDKSTVGNPVTVVQVFGDKRAWNLTNLKPLTDYSIRIKATTLEGDGLASGWQNFMTSDFGKY